MPGTYTGADSVVLIEEALNADQLNAPNYKNIPHLVAWNLSSNSLQYVNTLSNVIDKEIFDGAFSGYRNYVVVDAVYGDDNIASTDPYKASYSFSTIQGAVDSTTSGDLIVVNPGNYSLDRAIDLSENRDFYFFPNTIVQDDAGNSTGLFTISNCIVNIYGYANFILNNNKKTAFTYTNSLGVNFNCSKITILDQGLAFSVTNTEININTQEADCSNISGCSFLESQGNRNVIVNATTIRHSNTAYTLINSQGTLTLNVKNTISYDYIGAFNSVIVMLVCTNCKVFLNGDVNSVQTINNNSPGTFYIVDTCINSSIIVNGGTCNVRNSSIFRSVGVNCVIRINANVTNTQVSGNIGYLSNDSIVYLAGRFQADNGAESIGLAIPRAILVLEYGSLITSGIKPSIENNIVGFNMFYNSYYCAVNNAPQVTTTPLGGNQLIINALVQ
jgi:hypothetical protein